MMVQSPYESVTHSEAWRLAVAANSLIETGVLDTSLRDDHPTTPNIGVTCVNALVTLRDMAGEDRTQFLETGFAYRIGLIWPNSSVEASDWVLIDASLKAMNADKILAREW